MGLFRNEAAQRAQRNASMASSRLEGLLANRQAIIDPYSNVTDLSSMITNPFANLQVATQAAEMQAAETDISLAGTLDVLRATGAGAGGATALAQAAARSKQGISASIEQQEAQNARLRAQGEAQLQQARMAEAQRIQQAGVAGQQFMFGIRETREMQELDRAQALANQYGMGEAQMRQQAGAAFGSAIGGLGAFTAGGGFKKGALQLS